MDAWRPYDRIIVTRDPMNWDAQNVRLDGIVFYMLQDIPTMLNLYKAGELDAMYNHSVPSSWLEVMASMKDFMTRRKLRLNTINFNTTKDRRAMCGCAKRLTWRWTRKQSQNGVM